MFLAPALIIRRAPRRLGGTPPIRLALVTAAFSNVLRSGSGSRLEHAACSKGMIYDTIEEKNEWTPSMRVHDPGAVDDRPAETTASAAMDKQPRRLCRESRNNVFAILDADSGTVVERVR